jgi:nitroreductase
MDFQELFLDRRSIRRYTNEAIDKQILKSILTAAMYAPSAVNRQPWHFVVLDDRRVMDKVRAFHPHAGMLSSAPLAVVVCGDLDLQHDEGYWLPDCGAATENLLLAAHYHGLGACWVGLYPREKRMRPMAELLGLPSHVQPFSLVVMGHPAETKKRPERFLPGRVRRNSWENPYFPNQHP